MDFQKLNNISSKIGLVNDGAQVCVGHTLAVGRGYRMQNEVTWDFKMKYDPNGLRRINNLIANDTPEIGGFQTVELRDENIPGHACALYIFKTETTTYLWYNNPWGFEKDNIYLLKQSKQFDTDHRAKKWYDWIGFYQSEFGTVQPFMTQEVPQLTDSERRIYDARNLASSMRTEDGKFPAEYMAWEVEERVHVTRAKKVSLCPEHVLSVIFLLKLKHGKRHIKVFHPSVSMKFSGPQDFFQDGLELDNPFMMHVSEIENIGACAVWEELYSIHASLLIKEALRENGTIGDAKMRKILVTLKRNQLLGEDQARQTLGKFVFALSPDGWMRDFLHELFPLLPDEKTLVASVNPYEYYARMTTALEQSVQMAAENVNFDPITVTFNFLSLMVLAEEKKAKTVFKLVTSKKKELKKLHDQRDYKAVPQSAFLLLGCKHSKYFQNQK